jgi:hypothetical protein
MTPVMIERTPTFSRSSAWDGVSKITLAGWKEMGLQQCVSYIQWILCESLTYPIMRSYCC